MFKKLIVITSPEFFDGEAEMLNQLFEAGLTRLHVRKPRSEQEKVEKLINNINLSYRNLITMHYHLDLVEKLALGGKHFGYPEISNQSNLANLNFTVSCSVHNWDEYQTLRNIDYCFISPVFDSISKSGYSANKELEQVPAAAKNAFALGGVTADNCEILLKNGYAGIAVLGYLWEDKSLTLQRFNGLKQQIYAYGN